MKKYIRNFLLISFIFLLGGCTREYAPLEVTQTCDLELELFIHQGASAGHSISGNVELDSRSWRNFASELVDENGHSYPITFSFNGSSVDFIVEHEDGRIFASGMMDNSLSFCIGSGGGTLSGPLVGDLGDWRGEFFATLLPSPTPDPNAESISEDTSLLSGSTLLLCIYSPLVIFILLGIFVLYKIFKPSRKTPSQEKEDL